MRYLTTALLVLWCGSQERTITAQGGTPDRLVGKVWVATDPSAAPGTIRIFLADGTLVMDSCGETYRLSEWKRIDDRHVEWTEDGVSIRAEVTALTADRMRLTLKLKSEAKDETYRLATCGADRALHRLDAVRRNDHVSRFRRKARREFQLERRDAGLLHGDEHPDAERPDVHAR